jgi:hypothetical protein
LIIAVVWWPLLEAELARVDWERPLLPQVDWLLLGDFAAMSLLIMAGADVRRDWLMIAVGLAGGLVIEAWGTQTRLWDYYTLERPPLWIIPAWPIASLAIDRLVRMLRILVARRWQRLFLALYWAIFLVFLVSMLTFVWPTLDKSFTGLALLITLGLIVTPVDHRVAVLTFVAGAGLGYFLELWGTTRLCWTYYTGQTPPFFAVLAHGLAAVAFWRTRRIVRACLDRLSAACAVSSDAL